MSERVDSRGHVGQQAERTPAAAGADASSSWLADFAAKTFRVRRRLAGWYYRKVRWEFWPPYVFYPPVVLYVLYLGLRFRGFTLFTAANPGIVAGGFLDESKFDILKSLDGAGECLLKAALIPERDPVRRVEAALDFITRNKLTFPVVVKPDAGQRGSGVVVAHSEEALRAYLQNTQYDTIIQEYAAGPEFGVFYYRYPDQKRGRIFSITEKRLPVLKGDGRQSVEELILADDRAVCMADFYLSKNAHQAQRVPGVGEPVQLVELGTHCRGAIFLDGSAAITLALEETVDRIARHFQGFFFGRFDIRVPSQEDLKAGENLKVIELNGVSSEATHIYDPKLGLLKSYRELFRQWRIAFEIGNENRKRGHRPASVRELAQLSLAYRRASKEHRS